MGTRLLREDEGGGLHAVQARRDDEALDDAGLRRPLRELAERGTVRRRHPDADTCRRPRDDAINAEGEKAGTGDTS